MQVKRITSYTKHGCHIYGRNLVLVEYIDDMEKDPRAGEFGSMLPFDYLDKAKAIVKAEFGDFETLLGIPDLVARVNE